MPSEYRGIRNFVGILNKGGDALVNLALRRGDNNDAIHAALSERFPSAGRAAREQVIQLVTEARAAARATALLKPSQPVSSVPVPYHPLLEEGRHYYIDVDILDAERSVRATWTIRMTATSADTPGSLEARARQYLDDVYPDSPEYDKEGNEIIKQDTRVNSWQLGYRGSR